VADVPHDGPLFYTGRKKKPKCVSGFYNSPMGIHTLENCGKDVAAELGLNDPNSYTGHCWRRTAATEAANNGATGIQLKHHFNWTDEKMAMEYICKYPKQLLLIKKKIT
jgi:integrase